MRAIAQPRILHVVRRQQSLTPDPDTATDHPRHGWAQRALSLATWSFDMSDKVLSGEIWRMHNRAWQAVHVVFVVWGFVEGIRQVRGERAGLPVPEDCSTRRDGMPQC